MFKLSSTATCLMEATPDSILTRTRSKSNYASKLEPTSSISIDYRNFGRAELATRPHPSDQARSVNRHGRPERRRAHQSGGRGDPLDAEQSMARLQGRSRAKRMPSDQERSS
jgi:hypothetical protein